MSPALRRVPLAIALVVAAALGGSAIGRAQSAAQSSTGPPDVLGALLIEVRGLRAAMEQMASAGPRVQLALGRLQLQEQRVANLVRRLDDLRTTLTQAQRALDMITQQSRAVDQMARETPDADKRSDAEHELKALKAESARRQADVLRLTTEETLLSQEIAGEQSRWTEFNQRLEELERSLGRR